MNRDWEIVNVFLTHNAPDDVYQAWSRIRAEHGESPVTVRAKPPVQQPQANITVFTTDVVTSINEDDPSQIDCDFTIFKRP